MKWNEFESQFFENRIINGKENMHIIYAYFSLINIIGGAEKWNYCSLRNYLHVYYMWAINKRCNYWENDSEEQVLLITELLDTNGENICLFREKNFVYIDSKTKLMSLGLVKEKEYTSVEPMVDSIGDVIIPDGFITEFKFSVNDIDRDKIIKRKNMLELSLRDNTDLYLKLGVDGLDRKKKFIEAFDNHIKAWKSYKLSGWWHLVIDGIDNLPHDIMEFFFSKKEMREDNAMLRQFKLLKEIVDEDKNSIVLNNTNAIVGISILVREVIEKSIDRIKNGGLKLPVFYYVRDETCQYLLPLFFQGIEEKPDCFAVLQKSDKGWQPVTLLNLDEARQNIMIFKKYNADFLKKWWS